MDDSNPSEKRMPLVWSPAIYRKMSCLEYFPASALHLDVQKIIITRFLNFYMGGRRTKGIGVEDVVFGVLAIMPRSPYREDIIWTNLEFRDDGTLFFLTPEDKLAAEVKKINIDIDIDIEEQKLHDNTESERGEDVSVTEDDFDSLEFDTKFLSTLHSLIAIETTKLFKEGGANEAGNQENLADSKTYEGATNHLRNVWDEFPQDIKVDPKQIKKESKTLEYGPVENAAFSTFCNSVLNHWDKNTQSRIVLKSFFAVVALVLMRATTKGYMHLVTTFHDEKFLRFLRHMKRLVPDMKYSPPHKRCLKGAFRTFCRRERSTRIMFAKFLRVNFVFTDKYLKYVVTNGLLNYTADYGLNLVMLWQSIYGAVPAEDVKRIVELTTCDKTRSSWEGLASFLRKYKGHDCTNSSYRWARIIDGSFFKELSCQANYALAVLLGVFAERITGNTGIWKSTWVKNDEEEDSLKQLGVQLYEQYVVIPRKPMFSKIYYFEQ